MSHSPSYFSPDQTASLPPPWADLCRRRGIYMDQSVVPHLEEPIAQFGIIASCNRIVQDQEFTEISWSLFLRTPGTGPHRVIQIHYSPRRDTEDTEAVLVIRKGPLPPTGRGVDLSCLVGIWTHDLFGGGGGMTDIVGIGISVQALCGMITQRHVGLYDATTPPAQQLFDRSRTREEWLMRLSNSLGVNHTHRDGWHRELRSCIIAAHRAVGHYVDQGFGPKERREVKWVWVGRRSRSAVEEEFRWLNPIRAPYEVVPSWT